jgi:integrase
VATVTTLAIESALLRDSRHLAARAFSDFAAWLEDLRLENKADRTVSDCMYSGAKLLREHVDKELADYTTDDLKSWLAQFPAPSRQTRRSHLRSFFKWAYDNERIDRDPAARLRPISGLRGQKVRPIFSDAEITLMCQDERLALMLHTGIRRGECRRLQRKHITLPLDDPDNAYLTVYRGKGRKDRSIPLNEVGQKAVARMDLLEGLNPSDYIWYSKPGGGQVVRRDRPIAETTFQRWWEKALEDIGIDYRNAHVTRHTFATRYLRAGGRLEVLSAILGHASIAQTANTYVHLDLTDAQADMRLLALSLRNPSEED